jgi:hypothetical protein
MDPLSEPDEYAAPCGHTFDAACLRALVLAATANEARFPPRCCAAPLPQPLFRALLSPAEASAFDGAAREFAVVPARRRLYCRAAGCGAFLGARGTEAHGVACACGARTCGACGGAPHAWHVACAEEMDAGERALLEMGRAREWQRCPGCERVVEKTEGCVHMVCLCGTEFCYRCGGAYHDGPCTEPVDPSVSRAAMQG